MKCDGHVGSIHCDQLPALENFASMALALQRARGLADNEVRFFVGADQPESYQRVRLRYSFLCHLVRIMSFHTCHLCFKLL
jgi:hypothetical protein